MLAPANAVVADGHAPVRHLQHPAETETNGAPVIQQPQVYFGEQTPNFSIVDTQQPELDYDTATGAR